MAIKLYKQEFYSGLSATVESRQTLSEREKNQILIDLYADVAKCRLFDIIKLNYLENLSQDSTYLSYDMIEDKAFIAMLKASVERSVLDDFKREFIG